MQKKNHPAGEPAPKTFLPGRIHFMKVKKKRQQTNPSQNSPLRSRKTKNEQKSSEQRQDTITVFFHPLAALFQGIPPTYNKIGDNCEWQ